MTGSIQKKYSEISYILEDEEEEVKAKPAPQKKPAPKKSNKKDESSEGEYSEESGSE